MKRFSSDRTLPLKFASISKHNIVIPDQYGGEEQGLPDGRSTARGRGPFRARGRHQVRHPERADDAVESAAQAQTAKHLPDGGALSGQPDRQTDRHTVGMDWKIRIHIRAYLLCK